jgi:hypothetical protein
VRSRQDSNAERIFAEWTFLKDLPEDIPWNSLRITYFSPHRNSLDAYLEDSDIEGLNS